MRTVVLRVVALALLLLLVLVGAIAVRTMQRLPDTTVYLVRDLGTSFTLEPVHRRLGRGSVEERVRQQLATLAAGASDDAAERQLSTLVPADVVVRSARLDDGVLTVDLSMGFERGGGSAMMIGRLHQLFYTLTQPGDVDAVRLLLEGVEVRSFGGEGILVEQPWVRDGQPERPVW